LKLFVASFVTPTHRVLEIDIKTELESIIPKPNKFKC